MRRSIKVLLKQVLNNNRKYLKDVFELTEDTYLEIMSTMGPSNAFRDKYKNGLKNNSIEQWETANPTRGWCAQMTRFLKDYQLIPEGYTAYCDDSKDHYYFINENDEVIDLTIYQAGYSNPDDVIEYYFNKARFRWVPTESSKDAMKLNACFQKYYNKIKRRLTSRSS